MQAFDDVCFPIAIGRGASVTPGFSTAIVTTASGYEQRNMDWASGRMRFDAGPGVRSEADLQALIAFFRARRGAAKGFRFRDPLDHSSCGMTGAPTPFDQPLGMGDGVRTAFPLVKLYGEGAEAERRRITRPDAASVRIAIDGIPLSSGWSLGALGTIDFTAAPAEGATVTAGFRFDVPVRFAEDSLSIDAGLWLAGDAASVPLVEIREA